MEFKQWFNEIGFPVAASPEGVQQSGTAGASNLLQQALESTDMQEKENLIVKAIKALGNNHYQLGMLKALLVNFETKKFDYDPNHLISFAIKELTNPTPLTRDR